MNKEITYEQIIAGLLAKIDRIDNLDFSLLIEDFKKKTKIELEGLLYYVPNIGKYIKVHENWIITLKEGITLEDLIENENCSVKEKFLEVAGVEVKEYLKTLNSENYKQAKNKLLLENKEKVLKKANVLLISDIEEDYKSMLEYGFQNIDYFRSIIRADNYFKKHPKQLEKYQIVIRGNQNVQRYGSYENVELERKIDTLRVKENILDISLQNYPFFGGITYVTYLDDRINFKNWRVNEDSYFAVFDRIIENTLINHVMRNKKIDYQKFREYVDYVNPNRMILPMTKKNLKILYLGSDFENAYREEIAQTLGLNITFREDDNLSLGKNVKTHLGDYDIIIASHIYSGNILSMANESTEQCKDTGRRLTLLVTYKTEGTLQIDEDDDWSYGAIGNKVEINYIYGGDDRPDGKIHKKEFKVAIENGAVIGNKNPYFRGCYANMRSIIEASVYAYNDALLKNQLKILDLDFKTPEEYNKEYTLREEQEELRKENVLAPINAFDEIKKIVSTYLFYLRNHLIKEELTDLRIIESEKEIRIENIYNRKVICTMTLPKEVSIHNIRICDIQSLSKKGVLLEPERVGIYTKKYDGIKDIPKKINEKQEGVLSSIQKKVKKVLEPIVASVTYEDVHKKEDKRYIKKM